MELSPSVDQAARAPKRPAGHEHRTARLAHGLTERPHYICVREGHALAHEGIHVRGMYLAVPERTDRVKALVVGEEEEDVRPSRARARLERMSPGNVTDAAPTPRAFRKSRRFMRAPPQRPAMA